MRNNILFSLFLIFSTGVTAQEVELSVQSSVTNKDGNLGKHLIDQYKKQKALSAINNNDLLENARSVGFEKSIENFKTVDSLLDSSAQDDEKITLIKMLGDFYSADDSIKTNVKIKERLHSAATSNVPSVAKAAVLTYSRMGYFEDTFSLLKKSFNVGTLDKISYSSELSHLLWFADWKNQKNFLSEIANNNTEYARQIFSHYYADVKFREKISPDLKSEALDFLLKNEPKFSTAIGEFGMVEAFSYSDWLHSVAMMTNDVQPESYGRVIMRNIGQVVSNPKKTIAFLISEEGQKFVDDAPMDDVKLLLAKVDNFSDNLPYPKSSTVNELVKQIHSSIAK